MKKNLLSVSKNLRASFFAFSCLFSLTFSNQLAAQISGTKTVCSGGCDYPTIAAAVAALNTSGVGSGGVNIEVTAGHTETSSAVINLTATGTASKPIKIYTAGGGGSNAKITAYSGSGTLDGIFVLSGSDYVTIDGIDLEESSSNTTTTTRMEWGYALLKKNASSTPDGCSYNTIKNCKITLNKANNGTAGLVTGCVGIYMHNHIITSTTQYSHSDTTNHSSNYNEFLNNNISNVYNGIYISGYSSSNSTYDVGNRIGRIGQGNSITNFGGLSTICQALYVTACNKTYIEGNTIKGGDLSSSTLYGIYALTGTNASIYIRGNTITLTPVMATATTANTGTTYCILNSIGSSGTNNTVEITDNVVKDCNFANKTSPTIYGIYNTGSGYTVRVERNRFINNTYGSASLSCTGTHYNFYYSATNANTGSMSSFSNNIVSNYTRYTTTTGTTYTMYLLGGGQTFNITEDTVINNNYRSTTGVSANMYISSSGTGTYYVSKNLLIDNNRITGTSGTFYNFYFGGVTTSINRVFNNIIGNNTVPSSGYTAGVYGIYFNGSTNQNYIYGNKVYNINAGGGTCYGIAHTYGHAYIYNNIVGNLSATSSGNSPAIRGIDLSTGSNVSADVFYNTVNITSTSSSSSTFSSAALYTSTATSAAIQHRINNNIFINNATPGSSGRTVAHWRNGVSPDMINSNSQSNIYYAGSPGSSRLIYYDGVLGCQTINAYQYRIKIAEMGSTSENVAFTSTTGTNANFLHIDATTNTVVESNGLNIGDVKDDYDGDKRQGNSGYSGSGSAPDIGADEGGFTGTTTDAFPPAIYNVNVPVSCSNSSRTIKATIVDAGGVPVSGGTRPKLYYKNGKSGSYKSVQGSLTTGTRFNGTWSFTIDYTTMSGFASGDTAYVYCIVQDSASTPNISSFPSGASASSVNSVSTAPRDTFYFINTGAGMGGNYTVGNSGADFPTIDSAVRALKLAGLCGPATINIKPGTYKEKIDVTAIAGSSYENTITFQSSTGNAEDVIIIDSTNATTDAYVWRFYGAKYMTLKKVTLLSKGPTYGWGLSILGSTSIPNYTSNIKVKSCNIWMDDSTSTTYRIPLIAGGSNVVTSYTTGAKIDSLEIDSNYFKYGYMGINLYGASTTNLQDNSCVRNNTFYGAYTYGAYIYNQSGIKFQNNTVRPRNGTTFTYGVYMNGVGQYQTSASSEITGNNISGATSYANYLTSCNNDINNKGLYANNIITGTGSYGSYFTSCNYWNIHHNTINMYNPTTNYTGYNIYNTTTTNEIKNNILANSNTYGNTGGYAIYNTVANTPGNIDNNIYWHPSGTILVYNGIGYNASNFNTPESGGVGSRNYKPPFISITDLRVNFNCNLTMPYISLVSKDYFNSTRNTSKSVAGAHEAQPLTTDVGVVSILSPGFPVIAGNQKVRLRIINNGSASVDTITLSYSINNGSPVSETFALSNPLAQCDTISILLSTGYTHTSGCITLRAWVSNPNNMSDENVSNDTTSYLSLGISFSGTYTVGGTSPDFSTINDAVNSMVCGGVSGPVIFNIRPGIYREKVSVPNILGASNTNWITFQSSTGNADDVVIIDSTTSTSFVGNHYVWRFDNAKYLTLRKVSLQVKGIYGWGVHIFGPNSKKIKIKGCKSFILGDSASTSTFNIPLVVNGSISSYSTGAKVDSLEIDSNYFKYGFVNTVIYGSSSTARCDEIYVRNNQMYGGNSYGGCYYVSVSGLKFQNNFVNAKRIVNYSTYMSSVGQYLTSAASEVSGNKIVNGVGSYGMYFTSCSNSAATRGLFANNMVSHSATSTYGIYFSSSDFWDVYYNTFNQYGGACTYGFYSSTSGNIFKNNIFAMNSPVALATGYALYSSVNVGAGNIDYNIYWNPLSTNAMYHAGAYSKTTYNTAAAGGANSNYIQPIFYGSNDLRLPNVCLGTAIPTTLVTRDFFGTNRSSSSPIIGAHEVQPPTYSASAARVITPSSSSISLGTYDIEVEVRNTGTTTITSLDLTYTLNGSAVSDTYTGLSIAPCGLDTLKFSSTKAATFGSGYNEVRAYTGKINGNNDGLNIDDTSGYYGFCARLSGNYTINPSGSGSSNFISFTKAVTALYSCGVSGPVTFTAAAGTYVEQGTFPGLINGASKTNTVTFNGVDPTKCKITWNTTTTDPRHVVQFLGVKHVRFMNIGIENTGVTYGWGISLKANGTQGCDSMLIKGCIISVSQTSTSSNFTGIAISVSNTSSTSTGYNAQYTTIDSNTINGGYYGITWMGYSNTSSFSSHKNRITRNTFNNQYYYAMYLYYQDTMEITGNRVNNLGRATNANPYGIYTVYLDYSKINKNRICGMSGGYAIFTQYSTGSAAMPCQISNNMINAGTAGIANLAYGISSLYPIYNDIVYNSVVVDGNNSGSVAFYSELYYGSIPNIYNNNRIYNNNFINNGLGNAIYLYGYDNYDLQGALGGMNNNNYKTKSDSLFHIYMDTISPYDFYFSSFSDWSSSKYMGSTVDTKAISLNPEFFSDCDMHTLSLALDSTGVALSGYTDDIDGDTRSTGKTDIGADEYTPPANNLGPVVILKPQAPATAGYTDVWVGFKNFGKNTISTASIKYKIGKNGSVKSVSWSGTLPSLASDTAKFTGSNQYLLTIAAKDTLYAFTSSPNGGTDGYTLNDTIWKTTCGALSGNFTIGSTPSATNFTTWQEATTTLSSCGISAPVVLNVAAGTYTEQVLLKTVPGAMGNNTVTFRSGDGNPSSVTLQYAAPLLQSSNYTFKLKGAKRIILRDLTLASSGTTTAVNYGTVVSFDMNGSLTSDSNLIYNSIINGMTTALTSGTAPWVSIFSQGQNNNYNRIVKNKFNNGSHAIYWDGLTAPVAPNLVMPRGLVIDSNTVTNAFFAGFTIQYHEDITITNNIITNNTGNGGKRGMFLQYLAKGGNVSKNILRLSEDIGYGIYMAYPSYYIYNFPTYLADDGTKKFIISNNSISCLGTTSTSKYGFYLLYPSNVNFYNNSISMRGLGTGLYTSTLTTDTSYKLVNNSFAAETGTPASFNGNRPSYTRVDYNNYYSSLSGGLIASVIGSGYTSATSMAGAFYSTPTKSDQNSKSVNPLFVSTSDLHIKNVALAAGTNIGVSTDVENRVRNTSTPTIGAYEFSGDLRVTAITSPLALCKTSNQTTIQIMVKNVSFAPASNYTVSYRLNNGAIKSHFVSSTLNPGDSILISHSVQTAFNIEGVNTIKAFTTYAFDINTNDTFNGTIDVYYLPKSNFSYADTCAGNAVLFTSTSTVTGSTIAANSWKFGDGNSATGNTTSNLYTTTGTSYNVKIISTSAFGCVDSFTRSILILSPLLSGSIASDQSICYNTIPALLTSPTSASGSQAPYFYQWQSSSDNVNFTDISGATGLDYQPGRLTTTVYYRRFVKTISGCGPKFTNTVKVTTNPILNPGVIGSSQTICFNGTGSALNFSATPSGALGGYTYQWQRSTDSATWSNITGQTGTTFTPTNVTTVSYFRALVFSGSCPSAGTNGVKIKLYSPITGGTIGNGQTICAGTAPAAFNQITAPTGGPGSYTFQWQSSTDSINWNDISGATSTNYSSGTISTLTYFQRLAANTGCPSGKSNAIKVRTNFKPNVVFTASNHCYNDPMPVSNSSNITSGTLSYLWKFGDGSSSTSNVPNKTYASSGTYTVTLVATSNLGCKDSSSKSVIVATTPLPSFTFALKCQGDSVIFTDNTVYACGAGSGLTFRWEFGDGTNSNVQHARHHYNSAGTYNVKFKISLPGGFKDSVTKTVVFNIRSTPSFTATNDCYPAATNFTNNSSNYASLTWSFGDGSTSSTTATSFTKTYSVAGSYNAKLVSISSFGCRDSLIKTVNLFSKPKSAFSVNNNCVGTATAFNNVSSGASTYLWNFGDGRTSSVINPSNTYAAAGTYTVTLKVTSSNGCVDSSSNTVTIYPNPVSDFTTTNVCNGFVSSFTNASTGASSYLWNFGNGNTSTSTNPTYTYPTPGNYTVTLTAKTSNGCTQSVSKSYTVYSSPNADFSGSNVCLGNSITFNNSSTGATSNSWNFGDASTSSVASPTKTYSSSGNFNVKLFVTNTFGCKDSVTKSVTIFAKPVPAFTASNQCLGTAVNFTNQSTGAASNVWVFGDGKSSAANSPNYTYATAGSYTVKLIVTSSNSCRDSISKTITVYSRPVVSFTASPDPICRGGLMSFTNTTTNGASYNWTFGNGSSSTATSPTNIYNTHGNYNVKLVSTSTNGCKDSAYKTVTVWPRPVASFKVNDGCATDNLAFASNSVGAVSHEWTFGDASTSTTANPSKGYANPGTYNVKLIVTSVNGCKDTTNSNVTVFPRASVSFTNSTNFCVGLSASFTNTTSLSSGTMTHQWSFGDGNTSSNTNPTYTYGQAGNYTVKLTTTTDKGCINTNTSSVIVFAKPGANFNAASVCAGGTVTFNNTTTGGSSYAWDFGDAGTSTLASPTHTYSTAGTYTVKLTATNANNCTDVFTKQLVIFANPVANFTVTDRCIGQSLSFVNSSTGANDVLWQFGDGNSSNSYNPTFTYNASGTFNVTLSIKSLNGCQASVTKAVNVFAAPKAAFSINDNGQCINSNTFIYTDNSTISGGTYTRAWALGDGSTSTNTNPSKTYAASGNYNVKLVITSSNGCKDSAMNPVMVYAKPTANFTINNAAQCINGNLFSFSDASSIGQGSISRLWNLGDGSMISGSNAVKKYSIGGTYTIRLTVESDFGCVDSIAKTVTVYASPTASFTFNNAIQCLNGNSFSFTNTTTGAASFNSNWNLGDGFTLATTDASRTYSAAGTYTVKLNVVTPFGCKDSAYYDMKVLPNPAALSISGPNTAPNGSVQVYSVSATPGSNYNWVATNGVVLSNGASTIQVKWNKTGITGAVSVTENAANGCQGNPANYNVSLTPAGVSQVMRNAFAASLYPNPNQNRFTVEVSTGEIVTMSVYDQLGREVMGGIRFSSAITLSDHNLAAGIYTVKLATDAGKTTIIRFEVKN